MKRDPTEQDVQALQSVREHAGYKVILEEIAEMIARAGEKLDNVPADNVGLVAGLQERRRVLREVATLVDKRLVEWSGTR